MAELSASPLPQGLIPPPADLQDLERLRLLLLGPDYVGLLALKQQLQDMNLYTARVAAVLAEAIELRAAEGNGLQRALKPSVIKTLHDFLHEDPESVANALYPVMGPAIRKSIHETLNQTLETFNQLLEQSLSVRSLRWRFDAWRTGRKYAEVVLMQTLVYQVEQVFLIHRKTSLLLHHVVAAKAIAKDPDMVSSMLSAIQDFMADSFSGESSLNALRLGELNVLIEQGPHVVIAAVVRGSAPAELRPLLASTLEQVHQRYERSLYRYSGNAEPFKATDPLLKACLLTQIHTKTPKKPWLAYGLLGLGVAGLGYWGYQSYNAHQIELQTQALWQQTLADWDKRSGIVILGSEATAHGQKVRGLRDALAANPVVTDEIARQFNPQFEWQAYVSTEPVLLLQRASQLLQPAPTTQLSLNNNVLVLKGSAQSTWVEQVQQHWAFIAGVQGLDMSQLQVIDPQAELKQLTKTINQTRFLFPHAEAELLAADSDQILLLTQQLKRLEPLAAAQQLQVQLYLSGNTDTSGKQDFNRSLGLQRAETIKQALIQQGVAHDLLRLGGAANAALTTTPNSDERSVTLQVILQPID